MNNLYKYYRLYREIFIDIEYEITKTKLTENGLLIIELCYCT